MGNWIANMKWQVIAAASLSILIFLVRIFVLAISYNPHTFDLLTWLFYFTPLLVFPSVLIWKLSRRLSLILIWLVFAVSYISLVVEIWHSCLLGKCIPGTSLAAVVLETLFVNPHILGTLCVAVLMQCAFYLGRSRESNT